MRRSRVHPLFARPSVAPSAPSAHVLAALSLLGLCFTADVHGQSNKLGTYRGVINVSENLSRPNYRLSTKATVKISLPVSERGSSSISSEFLSNEAPPALVLVSQWDTFRKETSADSGGQFNTTTCSLAAPMEVPMTPSGVLNVDLRAKKYAMSIVLLSTRDLAFNCVHSRSGPFKKQMGVALTLGTGAPGMQGSNPLPFSDPTILIGKFTLVPPPANQREHGPIVQEWDLRLGQ
jgi:hypothetical protein